MSTVRTICPHCISPLGLDPAAILLIAAPTPAGRGSYAYYCGICERITVAPVADKAFAILVTSGVNVDDGDPEPTPATSAYRFTVDDLIDFHRLLDSSDWFTRLLRRS